jgi:hypothetical protein
MTANSVDYRLSGALHGSTAVSQCDQSRVTLAPRSCDSCWPVCGICAGRGADGAQRFFRNGTNRANGPVFRSPIHLTCPDEAVTDNDYRETTNWGLEGAILLTAISAALLAARAVRAQYPTWGGAVARGCRSRLGSVALTAALQFVSPTNIFPTAGWTEPLIAVSAGVGELSWYGWSLAHPGQIHCVLMLAGMVMLLASRNRSTTDRRCHVQVLMAATVAVTVVHLTTGGRVHPLVLRASEELSMRVRTVPGRPVRLAMTAACIHSFGNVVARSAVTVLTYGAVLVAVCVGLLSSVVVFAIGPLVITALLVLRACVVWKPRPRTAGLASNQEPADQDELQPCSPVRVETDAAGQPSHPGPHRTSKRAVMELPNAGMVGWAVRRTTAGRTSQGLPDGMEACHLSRMELHAALGRAAEARIRVKDRLHPRRWVTVVVPATIKKKRQEIKAYHKLRCGGTRFTKATVAITVTEGHCAERNRRLPRTTDVFQLSCGVADTMCEQVRLPVGVLREIAPAHQQMLRTASPDVTTDDGRHLSCGHCHRASHLEESCWRLHPELRPHCQRCGQVRHVHSACRGASAITATVAQRTQRHPQLAQVGTGTKTAVPTVLYRQQTPAPVMRNAGVRRLHGAIPPPATPAALQPHTLTGRRTALPLAPLTVVVHTGAWPVAVRVASRPDEEGRDERTLNECPITSRPMVPLARSTVTGGQAPEWHPAAQGLEDREPCGCMSHSRGRLPLSCWLSTGERPLTPRPAALTNIQLEYSDAFGSFTEWPELGDVQSRVGSINVGLVPAAKTGPMWPRGSDVQPADDSRLPSMLSTARLQGTTAHPGPRRTRWKKLLLLAMLSCVPVTSASQPTGLDHCLEPISLWSPTTEADQHVPRMTDAMRTPEPLDRWVWLLPPVAPPMVTWPGRPWVAPSRTRWHTGESFTGPRRMDWWRKLGGASASALAVVATALLLRMFQRLSPLSRALRSRYPSGSHFPRGGGGPADTPAQATVVPIEYDECDGGFQVTLNCPQPNCGFRTSGHVPVEQDPNHPASNWHFALDLTRHLRTHGQNELDLVRTGMRSGGAMNPKGALRCAWNGVTHSLLSSPLFRLQVLRSTRRLAWELKAIAGLYSRFEGGAILTLANASECSNGQTLVGRIKSFLHHDAAYTIIEHMGLRCSSDLTETDSFANSVAVHAPHLAGRQVHYWEAFKWMHEMCGGHEGGLLPWVGCGVTRSRTCALGHPVVTRADNIMEYTEALAMREEPGSFARTTRGSQDDLFCDTCGVKSTGTVIETRTTGATVLACLELALMVPQPDRGSLEIPSQPKNALPVAVGNDQNGEHAPVSILWHAGNTLGKGHYMSTNSEGTMDDEAYISAPQSADVVAVTYVRRSGLAADEPTAEAFQRARDRLHAALRPSRPVQQDDTATVSATTGVAVASDTNDMSISPTLSPHVARRRQDRPAPGTGSSTDELAGLESLDLDETMPAPDLGDGQLTRTSPRPTRPPMTGQPGTQAPDQASDPQSEGAQALGAFRTARAEWTEAANALGQKANRTISEMFHILAAKLENDGTTQLRHEEHPFRFINLFIPLSGSATDELCRPASWGPVPSSLEELQKIFPGTTDARVVTRDDSRTLRLKFTDLQQLREARLTGWRRGWLPKYPPGRGCGRILSQERLDHLVITNVMANTGQEAVDTIMGRLQKSSTGKGGLALCAPDPGVHEKSPGRFTVHLDAYGEDSAMTIFRRFNGKEVASGNYKCKERVRVAVFGEGKLAHCRHCEQLGHKNGECKAETMYLQSDSNGLTPEFCEYIRQELGASATFAGTDPLAKGDKPFGFAVFRDGILPAALGAAIALYTAGLLSHLPRITKGGGVHACRDCGQLDEDADFGERPGVHESADSPKCALHRRDNLSGRRRRARGLTAIRATPHWVAKNQQGDRPASGTNAIATSGKGLAGAQPLRNDRDIGSSSLSGRRGEKMDERSASPRAHADASGPTLAAVAHPAQQPMPPPAPPSAAVFGFVPGEKTARRKGRGAGRTPRAIKFGSVASRSMNVKRSKSRGPKPWRPTPEATGAPDVSSGGRGKKATSGWSDSWVVSQGDPSIGSRLAMVWTLGDGTREWAEARARLEGDAFVAFTPNIDGGDDWIVGMRHDKQMTASGNHLMRRAEGTWCVLAEPLEARP